MTIPNEFHFVFGLKRQREPFHVAHYLCLESCLRVNRPDTVNFHYYHEPHGPWWDRIRDRLELHRIQPEAFVVDHPAYHRSEEGMFIRLADLDYAHQADFIRLKILVEHGGVYADMDTLFVNPLPPDLFEQPFVLGEEQPIVPPGSDTPQQSLCNAVILSEPGAVFASRWLETMYQVFDGTWSRHSCQAAARLASLYPEEVRVLPRRCFYYHGCAPEEIHTLLQGLDTDYEGIYSIHLWAHLWWHPQRVDFSTFHAGLLTEEHIRCVDTTYNVAARPFLPGNA